MTRYGPNILLITADQLRQDCVGYSNAYPVRTPNLDSLAAEGTAFVQAYSHIPVCCPARQSLLRGKRAETFGALWNYSGALPVGALKPDEFTWSNSLRDNGYETVFMGKWGVHPEYGPHKYGYSHAILEKEYIDFARSRYPAVTYTNGYFGEPDPIPLEDSSTHWFASRAVEQIERLQATDRPWHLALHFSEPHLPCRPAGRFASMYDPAEVPEWAGFHETFAGKPYIQKQQLLNWGIEKFEWSDWAPIVARYYGVISQLDDAIGQVLRGLDASGGAADTIVVFTADHGDMCGSHRMMDKHYILYDDVVHVPLVIRYPPSAQDEGKGGRSRCDKFVYNFLDLAPTFLEAAGLTEDDPGDLHGRSLLGLVRGQAPDDWRDSVVASYNGQQFGLYTQRMIRTDRWKYVWNTTDVDELYDLIADPAELVNRIEDDAVSDTIRVLRGKLYDRLLEDGDALVANEWTRRQLLGG